MPRPLAGLHFALALYALLFALCALPAVADEWRTPQPVTLSSPSGVWTAQITPRPSDAAKGHARAEVTGPDGARTFDLKSEWMPVDSVLLDDGTVVTFDQWHALGYGDVAIAYSPAGEVRWSKTLEELIGEDGVNASPHSVSSIWWRKTPLEHTLSLGRGVPTISVTLKDENHLIIDVTNGSARVEEVKDVGNDPERLMARGRALADEGKLDEARAHFEKVVTLTPNDPIPFQELAGVLQRQGEHAAVVEVLAPHIDGWVKAVKPGYGHNAANALVALAQSQAETGDTGAAEASLRRAMEQEPTYFYPVQALGRLLADAGREADADAVMAMHMARNKGKGYYEGSAAGDIGGFYRAQRRPEKAHEFLLEGYAPGEVTNQHAYQMLAELCVELGHKEEAKRVLEQLIAYWREIGADAFARDIEEAEARLRSLSP